MDRFEDGKRGRFETGNADQIENNAADRLEGTGTGTRIEVKTHAVSEARE
ncbi:hypothetical protein [Actinophytocola sp. KF-1]